MGACHSDKVEANPMGSRLSDLEWPAEPTDVAQPAMRRARRHEHFWCWRFITSDACGRILLW